MASEAVAAWPGRARAAARSFGPERYRAESILQHQVSSALVQQRIRHTAEFDLLDKLQSRLLRVDIVALDLRVEEPDLTAGSESLPRSSHEVTRKTYMPSWSKRAQAKATLPRILSSQSQPRATDGRSHKDVDVLLEILDSLAILLKRHTARIIHQHHHVKQTDLDEIRCELDGQLPRRRELLQRARLDDPLGNLVQVLRLVKALQVLLCAMSICPVRVEGTNARQGEEGGDIHLGHTAEAG